MKQLISILITAAVLTGCSQRQTTIPTSSETSGKYETFSPEVFRNPDNTFRSIPFYSLNDSLEADEIARQLKLFKDGGFGGSFLHSRIGLLTPYLSDEWFDMMAAGLKASQELGIEAWFYDEDKWPSGFAGGIIPKQNADFRARSLIRVPKGTKVDPQDKLLYEDDKHSYICQVDRMGQSWYNGTSWVDLMNPEMVKAFIDCSYTPYINRFGGLPQALGMFTDEPQISARNSLPEADAAVAYSPVMDAAFKKLWGYDLTSVIPSLFEEVGDWRTVRLHYYRTVAYCMEQAWSKQIADYCEANGFIWTGHFNSEDDPSGNMHNEGNLMQQLRHMQQPGIDALGLRFRTLHNSKVASSVANQYGRARRLVEIFGISGHNLSFEDRMWITAQHTNMGINFMCPHLSLYSMKGERKRDYPPTLSYQQPYWSHNKLFEDFSARLCYFATCGKTEPEVCIISPIESDYIVQSPRYDHYEYDEHLEHLLQKLVTLHVNFDLGDEQIISEIAKIENNRFRIGEMDYQTVVLPSLLTIRPTTLSLLIEFAKAGGKVIVCEKYPEYVEGVKDDARINALRECSMLVTNADFGETIRKACKRQFSLDGVGNDMIWTHLRRVENGHTLQLSNTSRTETYHVKLTLNDAKNIALMNPVNGESLQISPNTQGNYELEFAPTQTWIVFNGKKMNYDAIYSLTGVQTKVAEIPNNWTGRRLDPNALPLDFAEWSTDGGKTWNAAEPATAIWNRFAKSEKKYNGEMLLRYGFNIEDMPKSCKLAIEQPQMYKEISVNGKQVDYRGKDYFIDAVIKTADIVSMLKIGKNEVVLSLDFVSAIPASSDAVKRYGTEIETIYLAGDFGVGGRLTKEQPTETWRSRNKKLNSKPLPVCFDYGSFTLTNEQTEFSGNLTCSGYPFYAGSFEFKTSFNFNNKASDKKYKLSFPAFESTLIDVELNGKKLPTLFCSPWEADVTNVIKDGNNELTVTLIGSLRNLMGPYHNVGGEFSAVGPATFTGADSWPNIEKGDNDWYDLRKQNKAKLWRDDYYSIAFGILGNVEVLEEK